MNNLSSISIPQQHSIDPRIHCEYTRLVKLRTRIDGFSLYPHLKTSRQLSGRHLSSYRGRGLNFEELRHYNLGDDIRNLDWKVTLRTGKPHVRSYTEEKDHNVILCVDQRSSLFFSSVDTMKSVIAAELASLCAWRVIKESDRVGFFLIKDNDTECMTEKDTSLLKHLQKSNDVLSVLISDPMEASLTFNPTSKWVFSDGTHQINVEKKRDVIKANQHLQTEHQKRCDTLRHLMAIKRLPFMEISTSGTHIAQFTHLLRT